MEIKPKNEDTHLIYTDAPTKKTKGKHRIAKLFLLAFATALLILSGAYFIFLRPLMQKPMAEPLKKDANPQKTLIVEYHLMPQEEKPKQLEEIAFPKHLEVPPLFLEAIAETDQGESSPVCGEQQALVFLLVGLDTRKDNYQSGLADVIRLVRIDFVKQEINMIALPRDMMIDFPEGRVDLENPMKINQAWSVGVSDWAGYKGGGNGAHSLAEAIDYNFGVEVDHYMVVNFKLVMGVIDAVGGIDVYLPYEVHDDYFGDYPSGFQHLDGLESLVLMRIRTKYSDDFRVGNQTIVLKALFERMKRPEMVLKIPTLVKQFRENVLTDLSAEQLISLGHCLMNKFESEDINAKQFTKNHITASREFIPSVGFDLFVYLWDDEAIRFIHNTLMGK